MRPSDVCADLLVVLTSHMPGDPAATREGTTAMTAALDNSLENMKEQYV